MTDTQSTHRRRTAGSEPSTEPFVEIPRLVAGRYRVLERIGRGGFASLYRALDEEIGRQVALKVLDAERFAQRHYRRFRRESRLLARMDHPNVVRLLTTTHYEQRLILVIELVEGGTLDALIEKEGALSPSQTLKIGIQITRALAYTHARGILHRDIKPANILLTLGGDAKLADFGIARLSADATLTEEGHPLGTLSYMSPEQIRGRKLDGRSDLFSLGCVLFEMLSGKRVFPSDKPIDTMNKILEGNRTSLASLRPGLPDELLHVVESCLATDPAERPRNASVLEGQLNKLACLPAASLRQRWLQSRRWKIRRRLLPVAAGLLLVLSIGFLSARVFRPEPPDVYTLEIGAGRTELAAYGREHSEVWVLRPGYQIMGAMLLDFPGRRGRHVLTAFNNHPCPGTDLVSPNALVLLSPEGERLWEVQARLPVEYGLLPKSDFAVGRVITDEANEKTMIYEAGDRVWSAAGIFQIPLSLVETGELKTEEITAYLHPGSVWVPEVPQARLDTDDKPEYLFWAVNNLMGMRKAVFALPVAAEGEAPPFVLSKMQGRGHLWYTLLPRKVHIKGLEWDDKRKIIEVNVAEIGRGPIYLDRFGNLLDGPVNLPEGVARQRYELAQRLEALLREIQMHENQGKLIDAYETVKDCLALLYPDHPLESYFKTRAGLLCLETVDPDEALVWFDQAFKADNEDEAAVQGLSTTLALLDREDEALSLVIRHLHRHRAYETLSYLMHLSAFVDRPEVGQSLLENYGEDGRTWHVLRASAASLLDTGRPAEALRHAEEGLHGPLGQPDYTPLEVLRVQALYEGGRSEDDADAAWARVAERVRADWDGLGVITKARWHIVEWHRALAKGKRSAASEAYTKALGLLERRSRVSLEARNALRHLKSLVQR